MPHKHKRKRGDDRDDFDLDPDVQAKPLPSYKPPSVFSAELSNKRRKPSAKQGKQSAKDDTPKAFSRLMAWQSSGKRPSALDEGPARSQRDKTKRNHQKPSKSNLASVGNQIAPLKPSTSNAPELKAGQVPKILPGESLSQFALRVDQSLPLNTVAKSSTNPNIPADIKPKARLTKHNKRLQKLISDWRENDVKLKEKQEEQEDDLQEQQEEEDLLWDKVRVAKIERKGKKKLKGKAVAADDPWKDLEKRRRAETKQKSLQDVVQAPPDLIKVKSKLKIKDEDFRGLDRQPMNHMDGDVGVDVNNVPNAVGSLRQREEMGRRRRDVIEGYRKMNGRRLKGKDLSHPLPRSISAS